MIPGVRHLAQAVPPIGVTCLATSANLPRLESLAAPSQLGRTEDGSTKRTIAL